MNMDAHALIEHFTASSEEIDPLPVLKALQDDTISQAELADRFGLSRSTVRRILTDLDDTLIKRTVDGYRLSGAGAVAVRTYSDARDSLNECLLDDLVHKSYTHSCLNILRDQPMSRGALASMSEMPSRSSVDRLIGGLDTNGIVTRTNEGTYALTETGTAAIDIYNKLIQAFEQILRVGVCLQNTAVEVKTLPAANLTDARLVVSKPGEMNQTTNAILDFLSDIDETTVDHMRIFASFYNRAYVAAFVPFIKAGTHVEIVAPIEKVQKRLPSGSREVKMTRKFTKPDNLDWWLHFGEVPCGLVVIDQDHMFIGRRDPSVAIEGNGAVFSSDPDIIQWGIDIFEDYNAEANARANWLLYKLRSTDDEDEEDEKEEE
jgi:predicted transcriptional regulator